MENNEAFWNKIYEAFERIIFEEFTSKTIDLNFDNFYIKIYRKENQEDNNFISIHRKDIYNFLDAGYLYATNSHFSGCGSSKDLKLKFSEIKIAYHNETNEMIAVSVYNPYLKGNKCVGLTATTNEELREFGKEAIKEIIKYDINNYKSFYWCECADAIEHYYSKFGGFPIPNIYAREILEQNEKQKGIIKSLSDDGYHYEKYFKNLDRCITKIIYGFNTVELFNKFVEDRTVEFQRWIKSIEDRTNTVSESYEHYSEIDAAFDVIDIFCEEFSNGEVDFPPYAINVLEKYKNILKESLDSSKHYSRYSTEDIEDAYDIAMEFLEIFNVLKLYKFE